jgi:predicted TIM-barrel fold metal-dependent hydrolase
MDEQVYELLLQDFKPKVMLLRPRHVPPKARFPVVDAHNHLFTETTPEEMIREMDQVGVRVFINVTGNTQFTFVQSGYTYLPRDIGNFIDRYISLFPDRFKCFTMSDFACCQDGMLIRDSRFAEAAVKHLEEDIAHGACGLKVTKELGLRYRDSKDRIIPVDDERLSPIWERAGELNIPVLIHTTDPAALFLPIDRYNEHYLTLTQAPDWSFYGSHYSKEELLEQRSRMVSRHKKTTFICAHMANYPEDLDYVASFLEDNPNVYVDISARIDELGRQPYSAREFMIRFQDRILFGTDMPVKAKIYRSYFEFLETRDEYFDYPDYVGEYGNSRWGIYGLCLPDEILKKIYNENACSIIPGLSVDAV